MSKQKTLCFAAIAAAGGLITWYITTQNNRRKVNVPIQRGKSGTVHLSAASLEQVIFQQLSEFKHVRPRRIRAHFEQGELVKITGTIQICKSRFKPPSIYEMQQRVHTKLRDWAGIELPTSALRFETILK